MYHYRQNKVILKLIAAICLNSVGTWTCLHPLLLITRRRPVTEVLVKGSCPIIL